MLPEAMFRGDFKATAFAAAHALKGPFEAGRQVAIAHLEGGRLFVAGGVDHGAVLQLEGEVKCHLHALIDAIFAHHHSHMHYWVGPVSSIAGGRLNCVDAAPACALRKPTPRSGQWPPG